MYTSWLLLYIQYILCGQLGQFGVSDQSILYHYVAT